MSRLERRYRLVLRLLPAAYRQQWEEEMVATFLDSVDTGDPETNEDHGRLSLSEIASVVSRAVRLRLGGADAPPRSYAWGQAVRLATLMATLANAVMATGGIAVTLWLTGRIAWLPAPPPGWVVVPQGLWLTALSLVGYLWLPAYIALVLGHPRVAQAVALLAVAPPALIVGYEQAIVGVPLFISPWAMLLVNILVLLGMAAFHRDAPPVPHRPWLLALPVGALLLSLPLFTIQTTGQVPGLVDWPGLACALVAAAMAVYLTSRASRRLSGPLPWSLALALLALTTLCLRIATLPDYSTAEGMPFVTFALAEVTAVLALGVPLAVQARRALRRLPPAPASAPETPHHPRRRHGVPGLRRFLTWCIDPVYVG